MRLHHAVRSVLVVCAFSPCLPSLYAGPTNPRRTPFVEVVNRDQLYQLIDKVMKDAGASAPPQKTAAAKPAAASKSTKPQGTAAAKTAQVTDSKSQ